MATLSALQTEIENYGFAASAYASRITTWLNEAQRHIARELDIPLQEKDQTLTLVNGTQSYSVAADFQRLIRVVNQSDDNVVESVGMAELEEFDHTQVGVPYYYALDRGNSIVFYPTPNSAAAARTWTLRYVGLPTAIAAAGDTTGFVADWDDVLKAYVLAEAYAAEDDAAMSNFWNSKYKDKLASMGNDLNYPSSDGPRTVPGTWDFI
jgi:hypothetical protein